MSNIDTTITDENLKKTVAEFFEKNPKLEWNQRTAAYVLAYVMTQTLGEEGVDFKTYARFLSQESLHGLVGNASQFKQWYYGKDAVKKNKVEIDDLAG